MFQTTFPVCICMAIFAAFTSAIVGQEKSDGHLFDENVERLQSEEKFEEAAHLALAQFQNASNSRQRLEYLDVAIDCYERELTTQDNEKSTTEIVISKLYGAKSNLLGLIGKTEEEVKSIRKHLEFLKQHGLDSPQTTGEISFGLFYAAQSLTDRENMRVASSRIGLLATNIRRELENDPDLVKNKKIASILIKYCQWALSSNSPTKEQLQIAGLFIENSKETCESELEKFRLQVYELARAMLEDSFTIEQLTKLQEKFETTSSLQTERGYRLLWSFVYQKLYRRLLRSSVTDRNLEATVMRNLKSLLDSDTSKGQPCRSSLMGLYGAMVFRLEGPDAAFAIAEQAIDQRFKVTPGSSFSSSLGYSAAVDRMGSPFDLAAKCCVSKNQNVEALSYLERGRGLTLDDLVSKLKKFEESQAMALPRSLHKYETEDLLKITRSSGPILYYQMKSSVIGVAETAVSLFAIFPNGSVTHFALPVQDPDELENKVTKYVKSIVDRNCDHVLGNQLLELLIPNEVWKEVTKAKNFCVVPDGIIHSLPFESLVVDSKQQEFVLDIAPPITYASSLEMIETSIERKKATKNSTYEHELLFVAPVDFSDKDVTYRPSEIAQKKRYGNSLEIRLAGSEQTGRILHLLYNNTPYRGGKPANGLDRFVLLCRSRACYSELKNLAPQSRVVHLACHANAYCFSPAPFSSVALYPTGHRRDFPFLTLSDLVWSWRKTLKSTRLVVIGGCNSGRGFSSGHQGVYGLSWGFIWAGSPQVVSSCWTVREKSTSRLFELFYSDMAKTKSPFMTSSALLAAKRKLKSKYPKPADWAAFVVMGAD